MSDYGEVTEAGTVVFRRVLPGPPERVWAYLTESEKRRRWLAAGEMDLRVGGKVELKFHHAELTPHAERPPEKYGHCSGELSLPGRVLRCEPPRLVAFTWGDGSGEAAGGSSSEVTFELTPRHDGSVLLTLTHRRLSGREEMISVAGGWHTHLAILLDRLSEREPQPFWATHARLEAEYERRLPAG